MTSPASCEWQQLRVAAPEFLQAPPPQYWLTATLPRFSLTPNCTDYIRKCVFLSRCPDLARTGIRVVFRALGPWAWSAAERAT